MALIPKRRLGDVLIDCNLITQDQLSQALKEQRNSGTRLGEALINLGIVTNDDIIWALGDQLNISYIHLTNQIIDVNLAKSFPEKLIRKHKFIPIFRLGNELTIVMADPLDADSLSVIESLTDGEIKIAISAAAEIDEHIDTVFGREVESGAEGDDDLTKILFKSPQISLGDMKKLLKVLSPEKVLILMLADAMQMNSDTICLEPHKGSFHMKYRIAGKILRRLSLPAEVFGTFTETLKGLTAGKALGTGEVIRIGHDDVNSFKMVVSSLPTNYGRSILMRPLEEGAAELHLKTLGFRNDDLRKVKDSLKDFRGLTLIIGPPGSGKKATMSAFLDSLPFSEMKIIVSTEDPFIADADRFLCVGPATVPTLMAAAAHDPDALAVTGVSSPEILSSLIDLAGRIPVVATLPVHDIPDLARYMNDGRVNLKRFASVARLLVNQRLLELLCPECAEKAEIPPEVSELFGKDLQEIGEARGCQACERRGRSGRRGVYETFAIDTKARCRLLRTPEILADIYSEAGDFKITRLKESAIALANRGLIDLHELMGTL